MSLHAGIEIDGDQVRATVIDNSAKKFRVLDFVEGRVSGETPEERAESLREVLGSAFFAKDRKGVDTSFSIGADRAILREITVPYSKDEMIAKTIRYESESYIFSHSIDDLIIEYIKCNESESGSRLILCAVEKDRFGSELEQLQSIAIDPARAELNVTALATTHAATEVDATDGRALIVQIEREHTTFVLLDEGRITKVRSVWNVVHGEPDSPLLMDAAGAASPGDPEAAIDDAESAIEDRFAEIERSLGGIDSGRTEEPPASSNDEPPMLAVVSDDEYEEFTRRSPGEGSGDAPGSSVTHALAPLGDPFDRIVLELERTFAGYLLGGSIDRLIVTGGEAHAIDAARRLGEHFETDAIELSLDRLESDLSGTQHDAFRRGGAVSLGLALRGAGRAETPFELRRDEFRFERRFERMMPSLALASLLLACLSLIWMVSQFSTAESRGQENQFLRSLSAEVFETFIGKPPQGGLDTREFQSAAKTALRELQGRGGSARSRALKDYLNSLEVLNDFFTSIERAQPAVFPVYTDFDINPERKKGVKSNVKLVVETNEEVNSIVESIRRHSRLFDVKLDLDSNRDGGFEASLELVYKLNE